MTIKGETHVAADDMVTAMQCNVTSRAERAEEFMMAPRPNETRWVQCKGYRCVAKLTSDGRWLCFATGEELKDIITVYPD